MINAYYLILSILNTQLHFLITCIYLLLIYVLIIYLLLLYFSHLKPFMYCLKLYRTTESTVSNNNDNAVAQKSTNLTIGEELWNLLTELIDWKQPPGKKTRESISATDLYTIVCKIKPRYKLVFYNKLFF